MDGTSLFYQMATTIAGKQAWQQGRSALYDGKHTATMVKITKDRRVSAHVAQSLDWPRIAVDYLAADCSFDAFENDSFGITRLLVEADGDQAIQSAITNSMIGAVSFVAIIPRDEGLPILVPFTGAEATGIKDVRGNGLQYGLAVKKRENGVITEFYLFEKGYIHVVNPAGEAIDTVDLGVPDLMPFVQFSYDPDTASKPFGRSRISDAAITSLDSTLRNMGLSEQVSLINLLKGDLLLVNGQPDGLSASKQFEQNVGALKTMFFDGLDLNGIRLEQLDQIQLAEIEQNISRGAMNFASSMSMLPTAFGEQPSNGSFSAESLAEMQKPYTQVKNRVRLSYGNSIKLLAIELFKMVLQSSDVSDAEEIRTVFSEDTKIDRIGAIGDAFQKLSTSLQALGTDIPIPEQYLRQIIGIPLRPTVIDQELPNFQAARARFRDVSIDGMTNDGIQVTYSSV